MLELAIVVPPGPALPERGFRGVLAPVLEAETGRTRLAALGWRREGRGGSEDMVPSFWRSRILRSRRLMCRSSLGWIVLGLRDAWGGWREVTDYYCRFLAQAYFLLLYYLCTIVVR